MWVRLPFRRVLKCEIGTAEGNGARVLLLGVTYKKHIADQRESPARPIARKLRARGAAVTYHDPYVLAWQVGGQAVPRASDLQAAVAAADLVIVLQAHRDYDLARIAAIRTGGPRHRTW